MAAVMRQARSHKFLKKRVSLGTFKMLIKKKGLFCQ